MIIVRFLFSRTNIDHYQLLILNPVIQFAIWMMTSLPRLPILLVSLCQTYNTSASLYLVRFIHSIWLTPAVAVFMPVPRPATTRPTIIYPISMSVVPSSADSCFSPVGRSSMRSESRHQWQSPWTRAGSVLVCRACRRLRWCSELQRSIQCCIPRSLCLVCLPMDDL